MGNQIERQINIRVKNLIFFGFLIIYGLILIYLCKEINVWEDEVYSLNTSSYNLKTVISQSYNFEGQPPVYFILLALWRTINSGVFFARFLSLIFIGLSAYLIYRIVALFSEIGNARWLVVIFLLNPFTVWAALEIRTYALLIFLSSISLFFFLKYYLYNKSKYQYYFLVVCLIGLYTQYFFSFLMIALSVSLLIFKGWKAFIRQCVYFIPLILLFIPSLYFITKNLEIAQSARSDYALVQRISVVLHTPQNLILALQIESLNVVIRWGIKVAFTLIVLIGYIKIYRKWKRENGNGLKFITGILLSIEILVLLYCFFNAYTGIWYDDRYMAIAFPFFILIFTLIGTYTSLLRSIIFGTFSIYFLYLLLFTYIPPVKNYDYKSLANYIGKIENQNEPILCYSDLLSLPLGYYYKGRNILAPLPEAPSFDENYIKSISDTTNLKKLIEKKYGISNSYLLISDDMRINSMNLNMNRKMVDEYLNANYKLTLDTIYYGRSKNLYLRVRRLININGN
jgi:hypothetical protein